MTPDQPAHIWMGLFPIAKQTNPYFAMTGSHESLMHSGCHVYELTRAPVAAAANGVSVTAGDEFPEPPGQGGCRTIFPPGQELTQGQMRAHSSAPIPTDPELMLFQSGMGCHGTQPSHFPDERTDSSFSEDLSLGYFSQGCLCSALPHTARILPAFSLSVLSS